MLEGRWLLFYPFPCAAKVATTKLIFFSCNEKNSVFLIASRRVLLCHSSQHLSPFFFFFAASLFFLMTQPSKAIFRYSLFVIFHVCFLIYVIFFFFSGDFLVSYHQMSFLRHVRRECADEPDECNCWAVADVSIKCCTVCCDVFHFDSR